MLKEYLTSTRLQRTLTLRLRFTLPPESTWIKQWWNKYLYTVYFSLFMRHLYRRLIKTAKERTRTTSKISLNIEWTQYHNIEIFHKNLLIITWTTKLTIIYQPVRQLGLSLYISETNMRTTLACSIALILDSISEPAIQHNKSVLNKSLFRSPGKGTKYTSPGRDAKNCDEYACLSVCLSLC